MKKFLPLVATAISGAFVAGIWLQPINSTFTRGLLLWASLVFAASLFTLSRGSRLLRAGVIFGFLLLAGLIALPGRAPDERALKSRYLAALARYVDAPYLWGGERSSGIDCSGLPRKVVLLDSTKSENSWLDSPVKLFRWSNFP